MYKQAETLLGTGEALGCGTGAAGFGAGWEATGGRRPPRFRRGAVLAAGLGVNAMTHPLAFALHAAVGSLACIEVGVIALEALGYHLAVGLARSRALLLASLANGATWGLGYLL